MANLDLESIPLVDFVLCRRASSLVAPLDSDLKSDGAPESCVAGDTRGGMTSVRGADAYGWSAERV